MFAPSHNHPGAMTLRTSMTAMDDVPWYSKRQQHPLKIVAMAGDTENEHGTFQAALRKPGIGGARQWGILEG